MRYRSKMQICFNVVTDDTYSNHHIHIQVLIFCTEIIPIYSENRMKSINTF